jgi:hypothetical protein
MFAVPIFSMRRYRLAAFAAITVVEVLGVADVVPELSVKVPFLGSTGMGAWSDAMTTGTELAETFDPSVVAVPPHWAILSFQGVAFAVP